jgi:MFS family permease
VLAARAVPQVVFLLIGGVWADRLPRNKLMVASSLASGTTQAVVAVLLLTGNAELWQLLLLGGLNGVSTAFFFPASAGIVPQTVPPELIQQANPTLRLALNSTNVRGAALGGVIVSASSPGWAIAVDAATFFSQCPEAVARLLVRHARLDRAHARRPGRDRADRRCLRHGGHAGSAVFITLVTLPVFAVRDVRELRRR